MNTVLRARILTEKEFLLVNQYLYNNPKLQSTVEFSDGHKVWFEVGKPELAYDGESFWFLVIK